MARASESFLMTDIRELFEYDLETGWFINRFSRGRAKIGERAGSTTGHGYRRIVIGYAKYYEHHLAWFYMHNEWPDEIDHINGIRDDNRIANLRLCTRSQNCCNTQKLTGVSGLKGAYLDCRSLKWYSKIQLGYRQIFLGNFDTAEEANAAYMAAVEKYHGEFAHPSKLD